MPSHKKHKPDKSKEAVAIKYGKLRSPKPKKAKSKFLTKKQLKKLKVQKWIADVFTGDVKNASQYMLPIPKGYTFVGNPIAGAISIIPRKAVFVSYEGKWEPCTTEIEIGYQYIIPTKWFKALPELVNKRNRKMAKDLEKNLKMSRAIKEEPKELLFTIDTVFQGKCEQKHVTFEDALIEARRIAMIQPNNEPIYVTKVLATLIPSNTRSYDETHNKE